MTSSINNLSIFLRIFVFILILYFCICEDDLKKEFSCYLKEKLPYPFDAHTRRITSTFKILDLSAGSVILYAIDKNGRSLAMLRNQEILQVLIDESRYYYKIKKMCDTENILRTPFHVHFRYDGRNVNVSCGDNAVANPYMSQPIGIAKDEYPPYTHSEYSHFAGVIYIGQDICHNSWNKNNICFEDLWYDNSSLISQYDKDHLLSSKHDCIQNEIISGTTANALGTSTQTSSEINTSTTNALAVYSTQTSSEINTSTTNTLAVYSENYYYLKIIIGITIVSVSLNILLFLVIVGLMKEWSLKLRFGKQESRVRQALREDETNDLLGGEGNSSAETGGAGIINVETGGEGSSTAETNVGVHYGVDMELTDVICKP